MWTDFLLQDAHFAESILLALIFFSITWLHLDSLAISKALPMRLRTLGFAAVSLSFLLASLKIESSLFPSHIISPALNSWLTQITSIPGLLLIIASLITDPIQPKPKESS
jgi:hypothetical protein